MQIFTFTFDGHDYHILNADDGQTEPQHGDIVRGPNGHELAYVTHDGEHWVAEDCTGPGYAIVHENEPDAAWTAVKAVLSNY